MIRVPQVRVVDEEGNQLGVMATPAALQMAQDRGYDLVEVAPMAAPPVVKFLDFGHYKYELTKREKEAKRRQRSVTFKEVRLTPKIGSGDFETKVHRAVEFLEDGDRIKVTVRFRGRELTHPEIGRNLLQRFTEQIKDHGVVERAPIFEGKSMFLTVASLHKPKLTDAPRPAGAEGPDATAQPDTSVPAAATAAGPSRNGPGPNAAVATPEPRKAGATPEPREAPSASEPRETAPAGAAGSSPTAAPQAGGQP